MFQSADVIFFKCKASVYAGIQLDFFDRPNEGYITVLSWGSIGRYLIVCTLVGERII